MLPLLLLVASAHALFDIIEIGHREVDSLPVTVGSGNGQLALKYQPYLSVSGGCVPFPAVNDKGEVSAGLKPNGCSWCGCTESRGQVYARVGQVGPLTGVVFIWFFPKNNPFFYFGFKQDWQTAVVWIDPNVDAPIALSLSTFNGKFDTHRVFNVNGLHPVITYSSWLFHSYKLGFDGKDGGTQPLVEWGAMDNDARTALNTYPRFFQKVSINDQNFGETLANATKSIPPIIPVSTVTAVPYIP